MAEPYSEFVAPLEHADEREHRRQIALRANQSVLQGAAPGVSFYGQTPGAASGAGAIAADAGIVHISTVAAEAYTLADGIEGQYLLLVMIADGGAATLTPANMGNGSTVTFDDVGDTASLVFTNGGWHFIGGTATVA